MSKNDNNVKIYRFASPFVIGNEIVDALITVKESIDSNSTRIYSLELTEIKKLSAKGNSGNTVYYTDSINKLHQKHEKIKSFFEKNQKNLRFFLKNGENAARFAVAENKPYYQIPWKESLHNVVSDKSVRQPVFVSETPDIFRKIGFTSLPMMMNPRHLRLNYYNRTDFEQKFGKMRQGEHAHALGNELEKLPAALKNPLAIVVNQTPNAKPGSIVAITDMNINGKKVVVPILIEAVTTANNSDINSHLILTVYDSDNWIETFLTPAIEAEKKGIGILYFNEEKASKYTALSKKKGNIPTGFVHNIAQLGLNVKSQTETFQFKNWFKDSKVVDENGEPLIVYHGTNADFTVFDTEKFGAWFSKNMEYAESMMEERGGDRIVSSYLSIQNPMTVKMSPQEFATNTNLERRLIEKIWSH